MAIHRLKIINILIHGLDRLFFVREKYVVFIIVVQASSNGGGGMVGYRPGPNPI